MPLDEKLLYLLVGSALGFVLGYMTRAIREIKEEVDEVVKRDRDESGLTRYPLALDVALIFVLGLAVWASFSTSQTNSELQKAQVAQEETQEALDRTQVQLRAITRCNTSFQARTIRALNERTEYTGRQAWSNVELQQAQARFLAFSLVVPPPTAEAVRQELQAYVMALNRFVSVSEKSRDKTQRYKYPTREQFSNCLERASARKE